MSNTSKGRAEKGSKYWMQTVIMYDELRDQLNRMIGDYDIEWLSPVMGNSYTFDEYSLNQKSIMCKLGIPEESEIFEGFWPKRQPQWDAIGLSCDGRVLYLVEAKAHVSEMKSKMSASNKDSKALIDKSMMEVFDKYYYSGEYSNWTDNYYQLANRLTFLSHIRENLPLGIIREAKLVLLDFVNDHTHISESLDFWKNELASIWKDMIGVPQPPMDVIEVFYDVKNIPKRYDFCIYRDDNINLDSETPTQDPVILLTDDCLGLDERLNNILLVDHTEPGGMGTGGDTVIITKGGVIYRGILDYSFSTKMLIRKFKYIGKKEFDTFSENGMSKDGEFIVKYLGFGNILFVHSSIADEFNERTKPSSPVDYISGDFFEVALDFCKKHV